MAYGSPNTPAPTMAVILCTATYHHFAVRLAVIGRSPSSSKSLGGAVPMPPCGAPSTSKCCCSPLFMIESVCCSVKLQLQVCFARCTGLITIRTSESGSPCGSMCTQNIFLTAWLTHPDSVECHGVLHKRTVYSIQSLSARLPLLTYASQQAQGSTINVSVKCTAHIQHNRRKAGIMEENTPRVGPTGGLVRSGNCLPRYVCGGPRFMACVTVRYRHKYVKSQQLSRVVSSFGSQAIV